MRLDHLLSKEKSLVDKVGRTAESIQLKRKKVRVVVYCLVIKAVKSLIMISGGDALGGNTRTHPEHDG